jgi:hypothetical protein
MMEPLRSSQFGFGFAVIVVAFLHYQMVCCNQHQTTLKNEVDIASSSEAREQCYLLAETTGRSTTVELGGPVLGV